MVRLLELPNDVGVLIGTFVPLDKIVVNTRSQALVAAIAPLTETFWRHLCRELGLRSSLAHEQPWRKCLLLYVLPLRRAVIAGDSVGVRRLADNFRGPGPVSRFEVPTETLRDALRIGDDSRRLQVLHSLFEFGPGPGAATHLGEALLAHSAYYCHTNVHIFRAIAYHLQRWNIKISALHYIQATHYVWRMQGHAEGGSLHFVVDFRRVPRPDVFRLGDATAIELFNLTTTLWQNGEHERVLSLLEGLEGV